MITLTRKDKTMDEPKVVIGMYEKIRDETGYIIGVRYTHPDTGELVEYIEEESKNS